MRKTFLFCCLSALLCGFSSLQAKPTDAPDYAQIKEQINNSKSESYYPKLMERFVNCDTTLIIEDYRKLYYGFALREDYIPYQEANQTLLDIRRKLIESDASSDVCTSAIQIAKEALLDNPFNLTSLSIIPICYMQLGDSVNYKLWDNKLHGILEAIYSSGDGETPQTAIHVISIDHEYEIFNRLGYELDQVEVVNNQTDFIRIKENPENLKGVYFNFGACNKVYSEKYK